MNASGVLARSTQMSDTQRKWAYLETLFIGSEEVKRELPADAERFAGIDANFKVQLKGFLEKKNCVQACAAEGLAKQLDSLTGDLELCEKALADFLEAKRRIFPRFYFVSQTMLLDILSNGNRPWIVAKNVNAMFQGVKELGLKGKSLFMPLRLAVTGRMAGPDVGAQLQLLALAPDGAKCESVPLDARMAQLEAALADMPVPVEA